jgi:diguanylate cyclase (GGDEF)-like protein
LIERYTLLLGNLRLRETLKIQSTRDPLTNLFNRRYMEEALEREARRADRKGASLGIIMADVDHFKTFNDSYGHEAGDMVLRELGAFLKKGIRQEDIACRYGGEEFVLILPDTSVENTRKRAEILRKAVKDGFRIKFRDNIFQITISLGAAVLPDNGLTPADVISAADTALYRAKAQGRDCVVVAEPLRH